jgi:hypothetical protein
MTEEPSDRIDFISAYCDRWCERCAYTARCSAYACQVAVAMCGDFSQGLELAVGRPRPESNEPDGPVPDWLQDFENVEMSAKELEAARVEEAARNARLKATPVSSMAHDYAMLAHRWLKERYEGLRATADPVVSEALDVAMHDAFFVWVKLRRALDGRDRHMRGEEVDDDPVQSDWNGSAKVALISIRRSEDAWGTIAQATGDECAGMLADAARDLHALALQEFPRAMAFVRPGFDEPRR